MVSDLRVGSTARLDAATSKVMVRIFTVTPAAPPPSAPAQNPLYYYKFTNELGQAVSLSDFQGQALAITFFFTRCPLPNFCPRLSRNFAAVCAKFATLPTTTTLASALGDVRSPV